MSHPGESAPARRSTRRLWVRRTALGLGLGGNTLRVLREVLPQ